MSRSAYAYSTQRYSIIAKWQGNPQLSLVCVCNVYCHGFDVNWFIYIGINLKSIKKEFSFLWEKNL